MASPGRHDDANQASFPTRSPHRCDKSCAAPSCPYMYDPGPEVAAYGDSQDPSVEGPHGLPSFRVQSQGSRGTQPHPVPGYPVPRLDNRRGHLAGQRGNSGPGSYAGISPRRPNRTNSGLTSSTARQSQQGGYLQVPFVDLSSRIYRPAEARRHVADRDDPYAGSRGVAASESALASASASGGSGQASPHLLTLSIRPRESSSQDRVCRHHLFCPQHFPFRTYLREVADCSFGFQGSSSNPRETRSLGQRQAYSQYLSREEREGSGRRAYIYGRTE